MNTDERRRRVGILILVLAMLGGCAAQKKNDAESKVPHVGAVAPEFELPDAHGGKVSLAEARKKGPVLIVFYLGYSCPRCVAHLTELAARKQELDGYRTQVLLVGPDSVEDARGSIESFGDIPFAMLCDPEEGVAKAYGLVDKEILYHGLFVVDQGGKVQFAVKSAHPYEDFDTVFRVLEHLDKEKE